jgi:hypothetical protein
VNGRALRRLRVAAKHANTSPVELATLHLFF